MSSVFEEALYRKKLFKDRGEKINSVIKGRIEDVKESGVLKVFDDIDSSEITILSRFIVVLAITADIFGLIPFAGNLLSLVFGVILAVLYFANGLGRGFLFRRNIRRWIFRSVIFLIEFLALGFSWLPLFTIEALIDFHLSKRGYYKKIEKAKEVIDKIK